MLRYVVSYAATLVAFLGIDFVWLNYASSNLYRPKLGDILAESPNLPVAAGFYFIYAGAIVVLAVSPALSHSNALLALGLGVVLGLAAYGTYDITNLATVRGWSATVTFIDIGWGMALTGVAATIGYFAGSLVGRGG
jgi:uncharacterized membrane protein